MRLIEKIKLIAVDPRPQRFEKLAGRSDLYRLRQGNDRAIHSIDDDNTPSNVTTM